MMSSQMLVPPSKDTLFIRGFTARRDIQDIREYFERQAGCDTTIEFFKQSDMDESLYVALKFETRDIAKDIKNRFDDTEVLGDRIEMTWFKDLRKARQQERNRGYVRMDNYPRGFHKRRSSPSRRYNRDRSFSGSASRSRSRSHTRSRGRSRDNKRHRQSSSRSRSSSPDSPPKSKAKTEKQSKTNDKSPRKKEATPEASPARVVKPSPQVRRDTGGEEGKSNRMAMEEMTRENDDVKIALEQQRLKRRQLELDEMARFKMARSELEPMDTAERRRKALSPDGGSQDDRMRGRSFENPAANLFWSDMDDMKKTPKFATKDLRTSMGSMDDSLRGRGIDDDDRWDMLQQRKSQVSRQMRDLDFSQDALGLIQEKKKDIEKVYKNDCETFVTVVKMLISKDPSLEEKLQFTLRENLKEIGQRCILDLREYMDRLREHDTSAMKMPKL